MLKKGQTHLDNRMRNWVLVSQPSKTESDTLKNAYGLPDGYLTLCQEKEVSFYLESINGHCQNMSVLHLPLWEKSAYGKMPAAEKSLTFFYTSDLLIVLADGIELNSLEKEMVQLSQPLSIVTQWINELYQIINTKLDEIEVSIEEVKGEAEVKANREVLLNLTELEQELVIFSRRLDDLEETLMSWLNNGLSTRLTSQSNREQAAMAIKKSRFRIHLYKELVESASGLLSDSIDNKLNSIMEFLQSIALVISIPTLIFSLFGMNTGGLIGRQSPFGTVVVIAVSFLLGIGMAIYLRRKEYL
ncbi:magnesium transporter CorA family protein [Alkalibacterium psychrotolerans]